jgi:hypothetical protein
MALVLFSLAVPFLVTVLFFEQPEEKSENETQQKAGYQGEMKAEIALRVVDVTRQATQPAFAKTGPDQQADAGDDQAQNNQSFARIVHVRAMATE